MRSCQLVYEARAEVVEDLDAGLAEARSRDALLWIELDHPDTAAFSDVARTLGLHPLAVEDAVQARDRPKLDRYEDHQFVSLMTLRSEYAAADLEVGRVMVFLGEAFVVTVRQEGGDTLERARRRLQLVSAKQPGALEVLHAVVATVVDDLSATSSQVEASLLASAERLFGDQPSDEAHALYRITRQLLALAHAVQPLIEPLRHLSTGAAGGVDGEVARRFQDVLDHVLVVDREVNDHSELLEHLRGSNDSRIELQQNTDMRKIAAWAAVIAVPAAITGFYGMNVPYPGFAATEGLVVAVILQICLAITLFVMFRRRDWL
jgi:magnesium transporter